MAKTRTHETATMQTRIPAFHSIEEEAAFWDFHDTTEFEDEFEDVTDVRFARANPQRAITVRLDEASLRALRDQARAEGVSASTLAQRWVLARLRTSTGR